LDFIHSFIDYILHLDTHLYSIVCEYGALTYLFICLILFCETGLIFTPFLPGDSLLFAAGVVTAGAATSGSANCENANGLNIWILIPLMILAVLTGDNVNYFVGRKIGIRLFEIKSLRRILKRKYLDRTEKFYEKYGKQTIILARYIPIVRTFAPFVAGIGRMRYGTYLTYCVIGGVTWVCALTLSGYFFGAIPFVKNNFELVIFAIILLSFLPPVIQYLRIKMKDKKSSSIS